ncbi:hypothetical protein FQN50_009469 [Emmonsiellopsis sp. PD_5]|nr:hypothetical protein FQN50_009469 [Emmonsiellopsis sp. PD_5]
MSSLNSVIQLSTNRLPSYQQEHSHHDLILDFPRPYPHIAYLQYLPAGYAFFLDINQQHIVRSSYHVPPSLDVLDRSVFTPFPPIPNPTHANNQTLPRYPDMMVEKKKTEIGELKKATANDMVEWLRHDGIYRKKLGWSAEWDPKHIFDPPIPQQYPPVGSSGPIYVKQQLHPELDLSTAIKEEAIYEEHKKYIKKMIKEHKKLIPAAIKEIDRRLVEAGVSKQEVDDLTTGVATDAYKKLARLDEATGRCIPSSRIQFRVMSDLLPGEWMAIDIYLPQSCELEDFEDCMLRHGLAMYAYQDILQTAGQTPHDKDVPQVAKRDDSTFPGLAKRSGCNTKVWGYKIAENDKDDTELRSLEGWEGLCNQEDFSTLMKILVGDKTKTALVCHETTLITTKKARETIPEAATKEQETFYTFDGEVDDFVDDGQINMELEGCIPIPDDFDWSQVQNGRLIRPSKDELRMTTRSAAKRVIDR